MSRPPPIGLTAHEAELARQLSLLNLPAKSWLTPRPGVLDVPACPDCAPPPR
jgi:hypothetical protein